MRATFAASLYVGRMTKVLTPSIPEALRTRRRSHEEAVGEVQVGPRLEGQRAEDCCRGRCPAHPGTRQARYRRTYEETQQGRDELVLLGPAQQLREQEGLLQ